MSAFAKITPQLAARGVFKTPAAFSGITTALVSNGASTAKYGAYFEVDDLGARYLILAQNVAASGDDKTVRVLAGNGFQSMGVGADFVCSDLGYGEYTIFTVDSGRAVWVDDDAAMKTETSATTATQVSPKGKIFIEGTDTNIKVAVFKLP